MTFEDVWRGVLAHCPTAGAGLAREWTQWAYSELCDERVWSHLRVASAIVVTDPHAGTVTVTRGSNAVAAGTMVFVQADIGRQLRVSSVPIYTILTVVGGVVTLDRAYTEVSGLVAATVLDAYITVPDDFARFIAVIDPNNKRRLRFWITQGDLDRGDPGRTSSGNASMLANATYSPVLAMFGRPRFELYPYQTGARAYPMWYYREGEILDDDDVLIGPLGNRGKDVLIEGALSRCALWPGTEGKKNPYFNLALARVHDEKFHDKITTLKVGDDELYFEDMPVVDFAFADFPWDASWLQQNVPESIG